VTSRKKQQKNRRDSIKDWRFDVLPPEHSLRQVTTSVNPVWRLLSFTGKPELIHGDPIAPLLPASFLPTIRELSHRVRAKRRAANALLKAQSTGHPAGGYWIRDAPPTFAPTLL